LVVLAGSERRGVIGSASAVEGEMAVPSALEAGATPQAQVIDASDAERERARAQRAKADECTDHKRQKEWQALEGCAEALQQLAGDDAAAFRTTARRERANAFSAQQLEEAVRAGNLKSGQSWLGKVDQDSVYFASARDELVRAETAQWRTAVRKATELAKAHQCDAFEQYVTELNATSTERIVAAARAVGCTRAAQAVGASAVGASRVSAPGAGKPAVADSTNKAAAPAGGATAAMAARPAAACEAVDAEALVQQAARLYSDGDAKGALAIVLRALACKQDGRMFRFAVTYACVAHDVATAKQYFAKVAEVFKPNLEQKCQQEGLDVRAP
jgi:hypothetical protein